MKKKIKNETTKVDKLLELARLGPIRARDLAPHGIPRSYLQRLCNRGIMERVSRGLYGLVDTSVSEHHTLVEASIRVPDGVICLQSALLFHGMTTELPYQVWMFIGRHSRMPRIDYPPLQIVRASGPAFTHGVEEHRIENVSLRITTPAKTVADCFRFRRYVGLDVAITALKDYITKYRGGMDDLMFAAKADRIYPFMRPYMEALV